MTVCFWIIGILCALAAINLNMAAEVHPDPKRIAFDAPLRRVFFTMIAGLSLMLQLVLAIQFSGLILPGLTALCGAILFWGMRKRFTVYPLYPLAPMIALLSLASALPLWQALYGETDFGFRDVLAEEASDMMNAQDGQ